MSVDFTLAAKTKVDVFKDIASIGDVQDYNFDCTAWEDDNETITDATWTIESGTASIASESVTSGVVSASLTFSQAGRSVVSVLLETAGSSRKKIWLEVGVKDTYRYTDDYNMAA